MDTNSIRNNILSKITAASKGRSVFVYKQDDGVDDIYRSVGLDLLSCFIAELETINGQCIVCDGESDLYEKLKALLDEKNIQSLFCRDSFIAENLISHNIVVESNEDFFEPMIAGVTACEFLVARTGSVLVSSATRSGRQMNVYPPIHIVLAHESQLFELPEDALVAMQEKYGDSLPSAITTITGPSRTADIEKTLVLGAHGPKEFIVFISKD